MRFGIGILVLFLALGCAAPLVWTKPGGTQDKFATDRYTCDQEAMVPYSGAYVDPYGLSLMF
jgi:hypothetical protein